MTTTMIFICLSGGIATLAHIAKVVIYLYGQAWRRKNWEAVGEEYDERLKYHDYRPIDNISYPGYNRHWNIATDIANYALVVGVVLVIIVILEKF